MANFSMHGLSTDKILCWITFAENFSCTIWDLEKLRFNQLSCYRSYGLASGGRITKHLLNSKFNIFWVDLLLISKFLLELKEQTVFYNNNQPCHTRNNKIIPV